MALVGQRSERANRLSFNTSTACGRRGPTERQKMKKLTKKQERAGALAILHNTLRTEKTNAFSFKIAGKRRLATLAAIVTMLFCLSVYSQDAPLPAETAAPVSIVSSPIFKFFQDGSNWVIAPFAIYDSTTKTYGGGIAAAYKAREFVVPVLRLDILNGGAYVPSGAMQLQMPITLFGRVTGTPFAFSAVATAVNNQKGKSGEVIGIFGTGIIIELPGNDKWYVPDYFLADYERWSGAGFNDNQYRVGVGLKF